jgi:nucleotide-binding universal stress UspA family protein
VTLLVAFAPDGRGKAVLHLAAMLAHSADDELAVCAVVPAPWYPSPARVDAEYRAYLQRTADEALEKARKRLPSDIRASFLVHDARSVPAGLLEVAERREAALIVVGSSASGGVGQVTLGSASSRLLYSSPIPVAVAPRGFRSRPDARVARVTAAFGGSESAENLVIAAAGVAAGVGATLRLASFAVRSRAPYTVAVGTEADESMFTEWSEQMEEAGRAALDRVEDLPAVPRELETAIGRGESWEEALEDIEWEDGDVLVVGSSTIGPVARVFLGSRGAKIVRHSPVPVVVVPRGAAEKLAEEAQSGG